MNQRLVSSAFIFIKFVADMHLAKIWIWINEILSNHGGGCCVVRGSISKALLRRRISTYKLLIRYCILQNIKLCYTIITYFIQDTIRTIIMCCHRSKQLDHTDETRLSHQWGRRQSKGIGGRKEEKEDALLCLIKAQTGVRHILWLTLLKSVSFYNLKYLLYYMSNF